MNESLVNMLPDVHRTSLDERISQIARAEGMEAACGGVSEVLSSFRETVIAHELVATSGRKITLIEKKPTRSRTTPFERVEASLIKYHLLASELGNSARGDGSARILPRSYGLLVGPDNGVVSLLLEKCGAFSLYDRFGHPLSETAIEASKSIALAQGEHLIGVLGDKVVDELLNHGIVETASGKVKLKKPFKSIVDSYGSLRVVPEDRRRDFSTSLDLLMQFQREALPVYAKWQPQLDSLPDFVQDAQVQAEQLEFSLRRIRSGVEGDNVAVEQRETVMTHFRRDILPYLLDARQGVGHFDATPLNVMIEPSAFGGKRTWIDLCNAGYGPLVRDASNFVQFASLFCSIDDDQTMGMHDRIMREYDATPEQIIVSDVFAGIRSLGTLHYRLRNQPEGANTHLISSRIKGYVEELHRLFNVVPYEVGLKCSDALKSFGDAVCTYAKI